MGLRPTLAFQAKKIPTENGWDLVTWWSRGELNPRPRDLCRQFYMLSQPILKF